MKLKKLFNLAQVAACSITLLVGSSSYAFDISILKNDKEFVSRSFNGMDLLSAKHKVGAYSNTSDSGVAFQLLAESFSELEKNGRICDLDLIGTFKNKLSIAGISESHKTIVALLIVWRSENLIDDVFFEIMEQTSFLKEALNESISTKISKLDIKQANKYLSKRNLSDDTLTSVLGDLDRYNKDNLGCAVDTWMHINDVFAFSNLKPNKARHFLVAARSRQLISPGAYELAEYMRINEVHMWEVNLNRYLDVLRNAKDKSKPQDAKAEDYATPSPLATKYKGKRRDRLSYRQSLYHNFDAGQINRISALFEDFIFRMRAKDVHTVFGDINGHEAMTYKLSPSGQYDMSRDILNEQMKALSFEMGKLITHEDLLTAALETGLIHPGAIKAALEIDDLWNPEVKPWQKIADYAFRVTGTATIFLPPPYNVVSSIAMMFINGLIYRNMNKKTSMSNFYDLRPQN